MDSRFDHVSAAMIHGTDTMLTWHSSRIWPTSSSIVETRRHRTLRMFKEEGTSVAIDVPDLLRECFSNPGRDIGEFLDVTAQRQVPDHELYLSLMSEHGTTLGDFKVTVTASLAYFWRVNLYILRFC